MVDGKVRLACTLPFKAVEGKRVESLEGLSEGDRAILAESFVRCGGTQCGYCTPGQIMSAVGLLSETGSKASAEAIREGMSGNLCRCGAYAGIQEAVLEAQANIAKAGKS
jgi:xanthine dehydrogenase YagT iron-sulfur-binding subunit